MLLIFLFFSFILSFSKDNIKHLLNTTIGLCLVYPDGSTFDISKSSSFQTLLTLIKGTFSFSSLPYSQHSLSDKSFLSKHSSNLIITREDKFLELYKGNLSLISISEEINQAFYSYVEVLNDTTFQSFKEDKIPLFLLTGPSIIKEFEDAAFFYKITKARFGFLYQNATNNESFISLCYIDNKNNVTRYYDNSIPIIQFIRSCKIQKSTNRKQQIQNGIRFQKNFSQFVAITDNFTEEVKAAFDYLNATNYGEAINFEVVSWENATDLMKKCQIRKSESNLTYVIYSNKKKRQYGDCYVFQDMDFYSKELLYFFVSKVFKEMVSEVSFKKTNFFTKNNFGLNVSPKQLTQSSFPSYVPGRNLALVFIECPNSFSSFDATVIFNTLSHEFEEMKYLSIEDIENNTDNNNDNKTDSNNNNNETQIERKYIKPVDFYKIDYNFDNFRLPSSDGFPSFVLFKPFDSQAHVFKEIITIENIRNWILKFATEEEDDDEIQEPLQETIEETDPFITNFASFIKGISIGTNEKPLKTENANNNPNTNDQTKDTESDTDKTNSNREITNQNEETIEFSSNSNINFLLSKLGLNFADIQEVKIITDIDSPITYTQNEEDKSPQDNKLPEESIKTENDDINKMIEQKVEIEVKKQFALERDQIKDEIIKEILNNISIQTKIADFNQKTNDSKEENYGQNKSFQENPTNKEPQSEINADSQQKTTAGNQKEEIKTNSQAKTTNEEQQSETKTESQQDATDESEQNETKTESQQDATDESEQSETKTESQQDATDESEQDETKTESQQDATDESEQDETKTESQQDATDESEQNEVKTESQQDEKTSDIPVYTQNSQEHSKVENNNENGLQNNMNNDLSSETANENNNNNEEMKNEKDEEQENNKIEDTDENKEERKYINNKKENKNDDLFDSYQESEEEL